MRARFVTFEGIEGVGKSTQVAHAAAHLRRRGVEPCLTREPGGTPLAETVRRLVLDRDGEPLAPGTEALLIFAARAAHVANLIAPALGRGQWVLCDRFTDASEAYQGAGRGISREQIAALAHLAHPGLDPDLTLLLDAPVDVALARAARRQAAADRFEAEDRAFFERVRARYLEIAGREPARVRVIDAAAGEAQVAERIAAELDALLERED